MIAWNFTPCYNLRNMFEYIIFEGNRKEVQDSINEITTKYKSATLKKFKKTKTGSFYALLNFNTDEKVS